MHIALPVVGAIHVEQMATASRRNTMRLLRIQIKYYFEAFFVDIYCIAHIAGFHSALHCSATLIS